MNRSLSAAPAAALSGPGRRLAQARTDLGLDPEQVAQRLRLSRRQVIALEHDDYSALPGPTYVRGYLRAYAALLGLAPEPLLAAYDRLPPRHAVADLSKLAVPEQLTSRHHQVRLTTYLVIALVLGLAFSWWQARQPGQPVPAATRPTETASVSVTGSDSADPPLLPAPTSAGNRTAIAPAMWPLHPAAPGVAATAPAAIQRPDDRVPAEAAAVVPGASAAVQLVLYVEQGSWADIRDARQNKLLYANLPAGRAVSLQGNAPLSVFLGNAAGLRLEVNGQPYDIGRYRRGMTARFTLGDATGSAATPDAIP
jgi:cytoskeleton protein RodZ